MNTRLGRTQQWIRRCRLRCAAAPQCIRPGFLRWLFAVACGVYLALWLMGGDRDPDARESRTYHSVTVAGLATTKWTHVEVCGTVTLVKKEADGDAHLRLSDGPRFAVAEIVPYHRLPVPTKGSQICVRGVSRYDKTHLWWEVHPVESWH